MKKAVLNIVTLSLVLCLLFSCASTSEIVENEDVTPSTVIEETIKEDIKDNKEPLLEISKKKEESAPVPVESTVVEESANVSESEVVAPVEEEPNVSTDVIVEPQEELEAEVLPSDEELPDAENAPSEVENTDQVEEEPSLDNANMDIVEETPSVEDSEETENVEAIPEEVETAAPVVEEVVTPLEEEPKTEKEAAAPVVTTVPKADSTDDSTNAISFPKPVWDDAVSPAFLQALAVVIVSTVVFTIAVAIRGANKMKLQKGISISLALLFPALAIIVSTLVVGWSYMWLGYLILLMTYFIFRARWRDSSFT